MIASHFTNAGICGANSKWAVQYDYIDKDEKAGRLEAYCLVLLAQCPACQHCNLVYVPKIIPSHAFKFGIPVILKSQFPIGLHRAAGL